MPLGGGGRRSDVHVDRYRRVEQDELQVFLVVLMGRDAGVGHGREALLGGQCM